MPAASASTFPSATRDASGKVLNAIAEHVPWLIGGAGDLAQDGQRRTSRSSDRCCVHRHIAPAEQAQSLGPARSERYRLAPLPVIGILGKHRHADAVPPRGRQRQSRRVPEEGIGELEQDSGTVAAVGLGARRAPVTEVDERLDALLDDRVSGAAGDPSDERHAAGVMFDGSVEQTSIQGLLAELLADTCVA